MVGLAAKANEDRVALGISLMLLAYLAFSFIDTSVKWLAVLGLPALQLAFMRYAGHFFISTALLLNDAGGIDNFRSEKFALVLLRAFLIMFSTMLNFFALQYLPLTLTATILFSAPLIVCALSWPLLGERMGILRWMAIIAGFGGIVIAIRPFDESFHWAVFLSLGAASSFALYTILTRKLAGVVNTNTMQFYVGAIGFFALMPFAIMQWTSPDSVLDWLLLAALGGWGWLGHQMLTNAHRFAPASTLTPYAYSFIIYLTVWSYVLFDHIPDRWTILGAIIVVAAGLVVWFRERRRANTL